MLKDGYNVPLLREPCFTSLNSNAVRLGHSEAVAGIFDHGFFARTLANKVSINEPNSPLFPIA